MRRSPARWIRVAPFALAIAACGGSGGLRESLDPTGADLSDAGDADAATRPADGGSTLSDASTFDAGWPSDAGANDATAGPPALQRILFVGDSLTHGRYSPVRKYNSGGTDGATGSSLVVDDNFGQTGARAESASESGPWGGVPGIFAELAAEAHLAYVVHLEAISATSLKTHYAVASSDIAQSKWDSVVLQEVSTRPIPGSLSGSTTSNPSEFCQSVKIIEQGVHAVAPSARIYLYATWARADTAQALSGSTSSSGFGATYASNLKVLGDAYHNAYASAAAHDGNVAGVAPVGDAWTRAWAEGVAEPNPFTPTTMLPSLWYGRNSVNDPSISTPDRLHPSIYGAYLSALVLFQQITGMDVRAFGTSESAAATLGIPGAIAVALQKVAWEEVTNESSAPRNQTVDPCTLTN